MTDRYHVIIKSLLPETLRYDEIAPRSLVVSLMEPMSTSLAKRRPPSLSPPPPKAARARLELYPAKKGRRLAESPHRLPKCESFQPYSILPREQQENHKKRPNHDREVSDLSDPPSVVEEKAVGTINDMVVGRDLIEPALDSTMVVPTVEAEQRFVFPSDLGTFSLYRLCGLYTQTPIIVRSREEPIAKHMTPSSISTPSSVCTPTSSGHEGQYRGPIEHHEPSREVIRADMGSSSGLGIGSTIVTDDELSDGVFEVERVVDKKIVNRGKTKAIKYRVRWSDCDEAHDEWLPEENLDGAQELVSEYDKRERSKKPRVAGRISKSRKESSSISHGQGQITRRRSTRKKIREA